MQQDLFLVVLSFFDRMVPQPNFGLLPHLWLYSITLVGILTGTNAKEPSTGIKIKGQKRLKSNLNPFLYCALRIMDNQYSNP